MKKFNVYDKVVRISDHEHKFIGTIQELNYKGIKGLHVVRFLRGECCVNEDSMKKID